MSRGIANALGKENTLVGPQLEILGGRIAAAVVKTGGQSLLGGEQIDVARD